MLARTPDDSFLVYALAMEFKRTDPPQAVDLLQRAITLDPKQSYAYFQLGQIHEMNSDIPAAKAAYEQGMAAAARAGDEHARGEIAAALDALPG
jgi:predicted TPR repeat methyltransferase